MRIGAVSDIHVDINSKRGNPDFKKYLLEYIDTLNLDVLVIPGDVAGSVNEIILFFEMASNLTIPHKIFVPGNHDIWVYNGLKAGSWIKYREVFPVMCRELNWHYLPGNPVKIDNTCFFGTMGWYDYSSANPGWGKIYSDDDYTRKINPSNAKWMDVEYARFNMDDKTVADLLYNEVLEDIFNIGFKKKINDKSIEDDNNALILDNTDISSAVFISHIVPFIEFINFRNNPDWDFFGAFIGNLRIGELLKKLPVEIRRFAFFGHTHFPNKRIVNSGIEAYCVPLGYPHEYGNKSLNEVFQERIQVVEV